VNQFSFLEGLQTPDNADLFVVLSLVKGKKGALPPSPLPRNASGKPDNIPKLYTISVALYAFCSTVFLAYVYNVGVSFGHR